MEEVNPRIIALDCLRLAHEDGATHGSVIERAKAYEEFLLETPRRIALFDKRQAEREPRELVVTATPL